MRRHPSPAVLLLLAAALAAAASALEMPAYARAFHGGDYPGAKKLASERLAAQPSDVQARIILARAEAAMGRFEAAYASFREAERRAPRNPDALYYLAVTAGALAEAEYARLLELAPGSARAHQLRGQTYQAQGRNAEAEAAYEAALAAGPASADVLAALGDLARAKVAFAEARQHYEKALERAPGHEGALYGLGVCASYTGEHATAVEFFRRALRVADSAPTRLALGISLLKTGRTAEAAAELEAATKLEPQMRQAYYHLIRAYQGLGRSADAEAAFARFQELMEKERDFAEGLLESAREPR